MSSLDLLVSSRKYKRKLVTVLHNKKDTLSSLSKTEKHANKLVLTEHSANLNDLNNKIQSVKFKTSFDEAELEQELDTCESYFTKIRECLAILELPQQPNPPDPSVHTLLKSPTAPLPKYDSKDGEDLNKFFDQFEETIERYNYPEYDKLLLLRQQISGRALTLINSLEANQQGYTQAKELLEKALASPETQKCNLLKQLTKLNLRESDDPFEYIAKMRNITEGVKRLKIDINTVMQYFFWEGLNISFRNHLTNITNKTRPSLKEINDNFFEACERYLQKKEKSHKHTEMGATALAANVNFTSRSIKSKFCVLCHKANKDSNHCITKCSVFDTPSLKIDQLKRFGGCIKCSQMNHTDDKCRFRFKMKCYKCNAWHMSYLCSESSAAPKEVKHQTSKSSQGHASDKKQVPKAKVDKSQESESSSHVAALTHNLGGFAEKSILPTFTGHVYDNSIRILKDSGSQSNFVAEDVVDQNFQVLKSNVNLTLNGINGSRCYSCKLVEFNLKVGESEHPIRAFTLPQINIDLKLPKLNQVVKGFIDKGYKLADRELLNSHDRIDNVKLILGSKSDHCIPVEDVIYGEHNTSVYSLTPVGILLRGDIDTVLNDLTFLPFHDMPLSPQSLCCIGLTNDDMTNTDNQVNLKDIPSNNPDDFSVLDDSGNIVESELLRAANEMLVKEINQKSYKDCCSDEIHEVNDKLVKFVLENSTRDSDGRLIMPLMWNSRVSHLLSQNKNLSLCILRSTFNKLGEDSDKLKQIDKVFKEQEHMGIIEKLDNIDQFLEENPSCSFLPFMGVFKPDRDTTKCRVVFLSNLKEKNPSGSISMSHNQVIHSGPSLNQKLHTSVLNLRFGNKLCCFDLKKAFNMIKLNEIDQNKLLFLWFRNIDKGDYSVVAYRNKRLSFGLRCSPAILMLGLFKILILDQDKSSLKLNRLKKLIYHLSYMDNCAFTSDNNDDLIWSYQQLTDIFNPYGFELQQFCTNDPNLQAIIDSETDTVTEDSVKLLGLQWQRSDDSLSTRKLQLNVEAKTKREVLSTVASQFDPFGYNAPLLNRSRLFLHELQCSKEVGWDDELSKDQLRNWANIVKQANAAPPIKINRCFGARNDEFSLVAFSDSSKTILGSVIYLKNETNQTVHFVSSKNKIVGKSLEDKSIPSLELQALAMTTENIIEIYQELTGGDCVLPINIKSLTVYSDSLVAITWLNSYSKKLDKPQKLSVFVQNRLERINKLCESCPVTFSFVSGIENPADCVTRALSYKQLSKSNFVDGPAFLTDQSNLNDASLKDTMSVTVPCYVANSAEASAGTRHVLCSEVKDEKSHLIALDKFSGFHKLVSVHKCVLMFVDKLKSSLKSKYPDKYAHFHVRDSDHNYYEEACQQIIQTDQEICFPEVFHYLHSDNKKIKDMPNIVSQLNVFIDQRGMLRIRNKIEKIKNIDRFQRYNFPLLISKTSTLAVLLIREMHVKLNHAGYFSMLGELRKQFWIPCFFSVVKKVIKPCILCKRFRERTIKLNQSSYRERRMDPVNVPYANIYIDFMGPFFVKQDGNKVKVWILCITCMWSRAVNLKVCRDLSTKEFLRGLQLHCFEYGVPQHCISDLGTQFTAGANIVQDFLKDHEAQSYFHEHGLKPLKFEQYFKGQSQLGSLVEVCVKMTKRLLYGAIKNNVVDIREFEFLICEAVHLINRRPVAFKNALGNINDMPEPITPEKLIHGYDLLSMNLIPELEGDRESEWDESRDRTVTSGYDRIRKVRSNLIKSYNEDFLSNLIHQATDKKFRYKPVVHKIIKPGDIVLIKDEYTKINNYPMAIVQEVILNDSEEVTGAILRKGKSGETVKRHVTTLIPLLTTDEPSQNISKDTIHQLNEDLDNQRPKRKTAIKSKENFRLLIDQGLV